MQENYTRIQTYDAEVIAISIDTVVDTRRTVNAEKLEFPVLSDVDLEAILAYNVEDQDFPGSARPATFLLESDGTIVWKSLDTLENRVPTAEIIRELGKLW